MEEALKSANWLEKLVDFARETGTTWPALVIGICLIILCVRIKALGEGIAMIISALKTNKAETKAGQERLGLEKDSKSAKIPSDQEDT